MREEDRCGGDKVFIVNINYPKIPTVKEQEQNS